MAGARETDLLTVAAIRPARKAAATYLFHERQRMFALAPRAADRRSAALWPSRSRGGGRCGCRSTASAASSSGSANRAEPTWRRFARAYVPLEKPSRIVPIEVARIDPTTFNFVDRYLRWPSFRLCTRIVPSYARAKEIFDFCAPLSYHLPGPHAVTPCIPFQYVIDGCYARAHQMRRIITTRYRYCCEKVFSFATANDDTLAVQATKWGGCCVRWW